jgi:hypothetical protein
MFNKRGQITLFIVIGIVIVLVGSIYFFVVRNSQDLNYLGPFQLQTEEIKSHVEDCLNQVASSAIYRIGARSGYLELKENYYPTLYDNTNYLYYENVSSLHVNGEIEHRISKYVDDHIIECVNFSLFNNFEIEFKETKTETVLGYDNIFVYLDWPLFIKKDNVERKIDEFEIKIDVRFLTIYDAVKNIIESTEKHPGIIDQVLLFNQNVTYIDYTYTNETVVYLITDEKSMLNNKPYYQFVFATKVS